MTNLSFYKRLLLTILILLSTNNNANELSATANMAVPLDFSLEDTDGNTFSTADFQGKVVLVNFWASWCGPCVTEIPSLRELYREMNGRPFEILAVNVEEGAFKVHKFRQLVEMPFPILLDKNGLIFDKWNAQVLPTSYLLDPQGKIRYQVEGPAEWSSPEVIDIITSLLPDSPAAR